MQNCNGTGQGRAMVFKMMLASMAAMAVRAMPPNLLSGAGLPPLISAPTASLDMKPAPIEPDWIIDGNPQARAALHSQSADEAARTAVWDCTAGSFRWFFHWDETVMILDGEVEVTAEDGSVRLLKAGDIAYFSGGTWATWTVETYVRKIAFLRKPFPLPLAAAMRLKNALKPSSSVGLAA